MSFINKSIIESNNLVWQKLANSYNVYNANGTLNKHRQIDKFVHAYVKVGLHKSQRKSVSKIVISTGFQ